MIYRRVIAAIALVASLAQAYEEDLADLLQIAILSSVGAPTLPTIPQTNLVIWHRPGTTGTTANQAGNPDYDGLAWGYVPTEGIGYVGQIGTQTNVVLVNGGWQAGYPTNGITVAGWLRLATNRPAVRAIASEYMDVGTASGNAATRNGFSFYMSTQSRLEWYINFNNGAAYRGRATPNNIITDTGRWYHVAATWRYNGNWTNSLDYAIYIDAVRVDNANFQFGTPTNFPTTTNFLQLGNADLSGAGLSFSAGVEGDGDEWVLYTRELTGTEITNLYNATRGTK